MAIEHFVWTDHAEERIQERLLSRTDVEWVVREHHAEREVNDGRAQWRVQGKASDGRLLVAIYDYPHGPDRHAVRIVSAWEI